MALLEIAIDNVRDGQRALAAGADRLEVCSDLSAGGCTPTEDDFAVLRAYTHSPLFVMIRPRPGSFVFDAKERRSMLRSMEHFRSSGADGFVIGAMTSAGHVDEQCTRDLLRASGQRPCTFHRAFDEVNDPATALSILAEMNVARILTSGGAESAEEGLDQLRALVTMGGEHVLIVPGGGVRPSNIEQILHTTGAIEIHSSGRGDDGSLDPGMVTLLSAIAHAMP